MKDRITKEQLQTASYKELMGYCKVLNVKFTNQPKEDLRKLLIDRVQAPKKEEAVSVKGKNLYKKYGNKIPVILANKTLSKSDKMRALYDIGITKPSEIAKIVGCHYSFVYGVIQRYLKT